MPTYIVNNVSYSSVREMLSYKIYDSTGTLTYNPGSFVNNSLTGGALEDEAFYNITLPNNTFKYYNLVTQQYSTYTTLCISTNGWLGFRSNIFNNEGIDKQRPENTLRFFSFDASSKIQYYFDSNNNLFISTIGGCFINTESIQFTIVIKVSPRGMIDVHYQSIGPDFEFIPETPIIGWTGNNTSVATDDIIYRMFNGINPFSPDFIDGKFVKFDFTGLYLPKLANISSTNIYTDISSNGYTTTDITDIINGTYTPYSPPPSPPAAPTGLTASISGTTATINFTQPSNGSAAVTSYTYATSSDNITYSSFVNTNLIKVSATQVSISGLTLGSTYYFKLIANNEIPSVVASTASNSVFVNVSPAAPIITNITSTGGVTSISFQNPSDTSITNYAYSTSSITDIYDFIPNPFTSYTLLSPAQTTSPLTINGLHGVFQIKIKAFNGSYSNDSTAVNNWYEPPF
jgi:hypothetical protein